MFRGYVLRYLAFVATGGPQGRAHEQVPAWTRAFAVSRGRALAIAAGFETERADDVAHVHRIAYLRAISVPPNDPNDVEGTRALFESSRRRSSEDRAFARVAVALVAVIAIAGASGAAWWIATSTTEASTPAPPPIAAQPLEEAPPHPLRPLFQDVLPDYAVALDAASRGAEAPPRDRASARERASAILERESPALIAPTTALLDASDRFVDLGEDDDDVGHWLHQLIAFNDTCEREALPFYVDARLTSDRTGRNRVLWTTYDIVERRTFVAGERRIRALWISRLDTLNYEPSLLGYTRPESRYALVVTDRIERLLIEDLLPSIHSADESVIVRDYHDEVGIEWVTTFENAAHEDLRADADGAIAQAIDRPHALDDLARAIVARRNAVSALSHSLRGARLREPLRYEYDVDEIATLAGAGRTSAIRDAQSTLRSPRVLAAYGALFDALAESIGEHETQHRVDYEDGRLMQIPAVLARITGETESEDRVNVRAERANAELSAYLSQIAQRPALARTSLIHVASFLMNRHSWGMPETYAAVALFESLALEANVEFTPLIANRRIVRAEVARIYGELRTREREELSALAASAWSRLYRAELPQIRASE